MIFLIISCIMLCVSLTLFVLAFRRGDFRYIVASKCVCGMSGVLLIVSTFFLTPTLLKVFVGVCGVICIMSFLYEMYWRYIKRYFKRYFKKK